jgi:hypothetical protein
VFLFYQFSLWKAREKIFECDEHFDARFPFITVTRQLRQPLLHLCGGNADEVTADRNKLNR